MGLGCRTGGYLVYICIAVGLLVVEIAVWFVTHETTHTGADINFRLGSRLERHYSRPDIGNQKAPTKGRIHAFLSWFTTRAFRDVMKRLVLQPIEAVNTVWYYDSSVSTRKGNADNVQAGLYHFRSDLWLVPSK